MAFSFNGWDCLKKEAEKDYFVALHQKILHEYENYEVFPPYDEIFSAFSYFNFEDTRVVILGQDPYHGPGQAHGLAFSVKKGVAIPPSLLNIFKEQREDLGCGIPCHGCLESWARQGVLLLNTTLTVRRGQPLSHMDFGWQRFCDSAISALGRRKAPVVFLLWGNYAKSKAKLLENPRHLVLTAAHPSPLSAHRGFFGCRHFSRTNEFLAANNFDEIKWQID